MKASITRKQEVQRIKICEMPAKSCKRKNLMGFPARTLGFYAAVTLHAFSPHANPPKVETPDHIEITFAPYISLDQGMEIRCKGQKVSRVITVPGESPRKSASAKAILESPFFPLKPGDRLVLRQSGLLGDRFIDLVQTPDQTVAGSVSATRVDAEIGVLHNGGYFCSSPSYYCSFGE